MFTKNISKILVSIALISSLHTTAYGMGSKKYRKASERKTGVSKQYIEEAIVQASEKVGIHPDLLRAICTIESNLAVDAFVYDDGGQDNHAYGMCQVLRKTAEKYIGKDKKCNDDFRGKVKNFHTCKLFGPKVNALAAAYYLKEQLDRYNGNLFKAAAAFNSGTVRKCSQKGWVTNKQGKRIQKCKPGDLLNRYYVKRVDSVLSKTSSDIRTEFAEADFKFSSERS